VAFEATTREASREGQEQATRVVTCDPMRECPKLPPELFPTRAQAIRTAKTTLALHKAVARYAFAAMWARHSTNRGYDHARLAVINTIVLHAQHSPVRPRLRVRFIAHVVTLMDEAARCAVEGVDA
jgi:hypothetical protein